LSKLPKDDHEIVSLGVWQKLFQPSIDHEDPQKERGSCARNHRLQVAFLLNIATFRFFEIVYGNRSKCSYVVDHFVGDDGKTTY
jgi:hypothetical protein